MDAGELFLFDLCGFIVVKGVLTPEEVAAANAAVDAHDPVHQGHRKSQLDAPANQKGSSRWDFRGMLGWEGAAREPFTRMLGHPKLTRYVNTICGRGHRMDHAPTLITQTKGSPSGTLHGSSGPGFNPASYYVWKDGQMHNGLIVCSFQLVDCPEGAGGLAVVPGTHKGNVTMPAEMRRFEKHQEFIKQVTCEAGDCVIFSEATTHGTLPWTADYQRRSVLFRYSPANSAHAGGRHPFDAGYRAGPAWPRSWFEGLSDAQRAVLEPPYVIAQQRPELGDDGELTEAGRALIDAHGWDGIGHNPPPPAKL
jgi:hypothetical protein